jgi:formamidase
MEHGFQHYLDTTVACKRAVLNCINYVSKFGHTKEQVRFSSRWRLNDETGRALCHQVYLLLSCCPREGRIRGIVDIPIAVCILAILTAISDQTFALSREVRRLQLGLCQEGDICRAI